MGIQTVIAGETRFIRTVWGAILGLMRLEILSVALRQWSGNSPKHTINHADMKVHMCVQAGAKEGKPGLSVSNGTYPARCSGGSHGNGLANAGSIRF